MRKLTSALQSVKEDEVTFDKSVEADEIRQRCKDDLKFFYLHVLDQQKRGTGRIHDYLIDFLRLHELDTVDRKFCHSELRDLLPARDEAKEYKERWLYWPTLTSKPEVQDGPEGQISQMFRDKFWKGLLIRVVGDGHTKCELMPRGHLKSTIASEAHTLWEVIREPSLRHLIRCATHDLACQFVSAIKFHFEHNEVFQALFGYLGPPKQREARWNEDEIQVLCRERRGKESTVVAKGMESEITGSHFDRGKFDDAVGEKNSATADLREKVKLGMQRMGFVADPSSIINNIGTIWHDDDAHAQYIRPEGASYPQSSFIVATLRDAEEKPIWPEVFNEREIHKRRVACRDDYTWFTQYFNQPVASSTQTFKAEWIQSYEDTPEVTAAKEKLSVVIAVDPANSRFRQSDYTGAVVLGQSPDGNKIYVLDGMRDRIPSGSLPEAIGRLALKWVDICTQNRTSFRIGIESFSFQAAIASGLRDWLRSQGRSLFVEELQPHRKNKDDRIKVLAAPYSTGRVFWPTCLFRTQFEDASKSYDFIACLKEEYTRFPRATHDDVMDAHAYAEVMLNPCEMLVSTEPKKPVLMTDQDSREEDLRRSDEEKEVVGAGAGRYFPPDHDSRFMSEPAMRDWRGSY